MLLRKTLWSPGYIALLELMREVMEEADLQAKHLAERLDKPPSYVSKVLKGERKVDPEDCSRWAEACGMPAKMFWIRYARVRDKALAAGAQ